MPENIPSSSTMIELIGGSLFEVWQKLCSTIEVNTKWSEYGIRVVRTGHMNINTAEGAKRFVLYMQNGIVLVS